MHHFVQNPYKTILWINLQPGFNYWCSLRSFEMDKSWVIFVLVAEGCCTVPISSFLQVHILFPRWKQTSTKSRNIQTRPSFFSSKVATWKHRKVPSLRQLDCMFQGFQVDRNERTATSGISRELPIHAFGTHNLIFFCVIRYNSLGTMGCWAPNGRTPCTHLYTPSPNH